MPPASDDAGDLCFEWTLEVATALSDGDCKDRHSVLFTAREVQVAPQMPSTLRGEFRGEVRDADRRHELNASTCSGDGYIQTALATGLGERSEVHRELAVLILPVAHAEDDDVALVSLYGLEVFYEQAIESALLADAAELRMSIGELVQHRVDGRRLSFGERHDAQGQVRMLLGVEQHTLADLLGLDRIVTLAAAPIDTIHVEHFHAQVVRLLHGAREREKVRIVEAVVRVGDQVLMLAAVVPAKRH